MSEDLVHRLRECAVSSNDVRFEAADRIEALEFGSRANGREIEILISRNSALHKRIYVLQSALKGVYDLLDLEPDMLIVEFPDLVKSARKIINNTLEERK